MKISTNLFFTVVICFIIISCGDSEKESVKVGEEYTERLIRDLKGSDYSVVLNDMNVSEKEDKRLFQHKYHILKVENDSLLVDSLDWKTVNKGFFEKHENDLGMEIVSNHNHKLSRIAKPVGFDWAVGNSQHGAWEEQKQDSTSTSSNTTSRRVWRSHSSSGIFWYWMLSRRRTYQRDYIMNKAYNSGGRSYYGSNNYGGTKYGTNSTYQRKRRPSFYSRKNTSSSWKSFSSSRKSASSSRYDGGSSTRSRSGGFGK